MIGREEVLLVLKRRDPGEFLFAPNLWQWNTHRINQKRVIPGLPIEATQMDLIRFLGCQVFSRNVYSNPYEYWFGGLTETIWEGVDYQEHKECSGDDTIMTRVYLMREGVLRERLRYVWTESTLVQEEYLVKDLASELILYRNLISRKKYSFLKDTYLREIAKIGEDGVLVAGEVYSPLKLLHLHLGPVNTTFALMDYPEICAEIMTLHQDATLKYIKNMLICGVKVVMSMDNLDTMFHSPAYVEAYAADFYEKAARICHDHDSLFFIHACGKQKGNLKLISSLGVDGLEGVAFPPLGDVELDEAMRLTGESFIITGGISALEIENLTTRDKIFSYTKELFQRMKPYRHRFLFSASCNTPINTPWETILAFRDAWAEYKQV